MSERGHFSLVQHGPAYRLLARAGLAPPMQFLLAIAITWLPLVILSAFAGTAIGHRVRVPFFRDLIVHARLLVALPLYLLVAKLIDRGVQVAAEEFLVRGLIADEDRYRALIQSSERLLELGAMEAVILLLAFPRAYLHVSQQLYTSWMASGDTLTAAGWWYALISLPVLFFVSGRWAWRYLIWSYYLVGVSRMDLRLEPTHPDSAGGLGFIGVSHTRFGYIAFAASCGFSANAAMLVLVLGHKLADYQIPIIALVVVQIGFLIAPILAFTPLLRHTAQQGRRRFGRLGMRYVRRFDARWIEDQSSDEELLGTSDIQSLADLANSYQVVAQVRHLLLRRNDLVYLVAMCAVPFVPLLLTKMPVKDLIKLILSVVK